MDNTRTKLQQQAPQAWEWFCNEDEGVISDIHALAHDGGNVNQIARNLELGLPVAEVEMVVQAVLDGAI